MINNLIEKIKDELRKNKVPCMHSIVFHVLYEILSLKHLCDEKKISYDEIMKIDKLASLNLEDENLSFLLDINYKRLLHELQYESLIEIIKEYVSNKNNIFNELIFSNKKRIVLVDRYTANFFYYDLKGNTIYIINDNYNPLYPIFMLFDKVLKINNEYKKINEIDLSNYEELHYFNMLSKYSSFSLDEDGLENICNYVKLGLRVILHTNYHCINNYKNGRFTLKYLKNIIFLPLDKSILIYEKKDNDDISIINFNDEDLEKLKKIIISNRKMKDVLIKVNSKDIRLNNYRLGFRLYQLEYENKNKTINEIVDYNTRLIAKLERINEIVEKEINYLINR